MKQRIICGSLTAVVFALLFSVLLLPRLFAPSAPEAVAQEPPAAEKTVLVLPAEDSVLFSAAAEDLAQLPDGPLRLQSGAYCLIEDGDLADPGLHRLGLALYCVRSDGTLLRNRTWNGLRFGADGTYTTGDPALDAWVCDFIRTNAGGLTGLDALRACYRSLVDSVDYQAGDHYPHGAPERDWAREAVGRLLERDQGNCYSYAAAICYIARQLGFSAVPISGAVDLPDYDHSWTELDLDGEIRILDPELNHTRLPLTPLALCLISYDDAPYTYYRP